MGNKPAGQKIRQGFQSFGKKLESGFRTVYDKAIVPAYQKLAPVVEKTAGRLLDTGGRALDLVDHTLGNAAKAQDSLTDALGQLGKPWFLYPAIIVGGLVVYKVLDSKKR